MWTGFLPPGPELDDNSTVEEFDNWRLSEHKNTYMKPRDLTQGFMEASANISWNSARITNVWSLA